MTKVAIFMTIVMSLMTNACSVPLDYLIQRTAYATGCDMSGVVIVDKPPRGSRYNFSWIAQCGERKYGCSQVTNHYGWLSIQKCADVLDVIIDNLAFNHGCNHEPITLIKAPRWIEGEKVFRLDACGQKYDCTVTSEYNNCEPLTVPQNTRPPTEADQLSQQEVNDVFFQVERQALTCTAVNNHPPQITIRFQINGDGHAIYVGTNPWAPPQVSNCLNQLITTLRFRATNGAPRIFTSPPLIINRLSPK